MADDKTPDMVTRVAKAICCPNQKCAAEYEGIVTATIPHVVICRAIGLYGTAYAVLKAMREPTEAMLEAPPPIAGENPGTSEIWRAMIDAALE